MPIPYQLTLSHQPCNAQATVKLTCRQRSSGDILHGGHFERRQHISARLSCSSPWSILHSRHGDWSPSASVLRFCVLGGRSVRVCERRALWGRNGAWGRSAIQDRQCRQALEEYELFRNASCIVRIRVGPCCSCFRKHRFVLWARVQVSRLSFILRLLSAR